MLALGRERCVARSCEYSELHAMSPLRLTARVPMGRLTVGVRLCQCVASTATAIVEVEPIYGRNNLGLILVAIMNSIVIFAVGVQYHRRNRRACTAARFRVPLAPLSPDDRLRQAQVCRVHCTGTCLLAFLLLLRQWTPVAGYAVY